jgi:hypothetical protein
MKTAFLIVSLAIAGSSLWAQDFTARQQRVPQNRAPRVAPQHPSEGVLQRAVRVGNPLQMINPFASREYGDGSEFLYYDEKDHFQQSQGRASHPKGIKFLGFSW